MGNNEQDVVQNYVLDLSLNPVKGLYQAPYSATILEHILSLVIRFLYI